MSDPEPFSSTRPRAILAVLTLLTTAAGTWMFASARTGGPLVLGLALDAMFAVLLLWVSFSFWMATAGFLRLALRAPRAACSAPSGKRQPPQGRTAILMPVYNESPDRVFAGLRAIYESLESTGHGRVFDFFILSDTTDPDLWIAEELAWARLNQVTAGESGVYYRHRPQNTGRKSGNIADFCQRWGAAYRYMVVLDADSVMSGDTLVEMVRRMDEDDELGILQAPPIPVNRVSLFARCQQFAASIYGPIFLEGFAWWSHIDGNYWGHNAIIRVEAFTRYCGLSKLPGTAPLGGEILSHDFVEAALMRRAGLKVCLAHDLAGSYEECPPTLIDYAQRDQRWCQGNMQHMRLMLSCGMHPISRLHFGMGAMSYLSSPLWMTFLILSFLVAVADGSARGPAANASPWWAGGLFAATMSLLLLPKLWSYLLLLRDPARLSLCGGAGKAAASVLVETLISMLVAPVMMAFHATFVIATFLGRRVTWNAQQRGEQGQRWQAAIAAHGKQSLAGIIAGLLVWHFAPAMFAWMLPILVGLVLAIPLSMLLSSVPVGRALARRGLLLTPEETAAPRVLRRHRYLLGLAPVRALSSVRGMFHRLLADPALVALHRSILLATEASRRADARQVRLAERQLLSGGPRRVSTENRRAILGDASALAALHLFAWTTTRKVEVE